MKEKKGKEEIKREEIRKILEEVRPKIEIEESEDEFFSDEIFYTEEYYRFLKDIKKYPQTIYEKLCWKAKKLLHVKPDAKTEAKLKADIETAYMNITPEGVLALSLVIFLVGAFFTAFVLLLTRDVLFTLFFFLIFSGFAWYSFKYPEIKSREVQVKMSSDVVIAILYMVISMRIAPNLERAFKFAAENLSGPLSWDLKRFLWNLEVGKYPSFHLAFEAYVAKWKDKNEEFVEALQLLKAASGERRERMLSLLDEAVEVILYGTRERMHVYSRKLRMPVMLIYSMGILLPIIGLVMFPIFSIFMSDLVKPLFLFLLYDVALPVVLLGVISNLLRTRPVTFSQPDVSMVKGLPRLGKFKLFGREISVLPFSVLSGLFFVIPGAINVSKTQLTSVESIYLQLLYSFFITFGVALAIVVYCFLDAFQKIRVRKKIEKIEEEFGEALYQIGNQIAGGRPLEVALSRAVADMKNLEISDLFKEIIDKMKYLGVTLEQAIFDKSFGALRKYPSRLIASVLKVLVKSMQKSYTLAALTALTLARYMKGVKNTKEEIMDMLSETITSMNFLANFLAPLIAGIIVTLGTVIIQIIFRLQEKLSSLMSSSTIPTNIPFIFWGFMGKTHALPITPAAFQLIVGLYVVEVSVVISYFINRLEYGEDAIGLRNTIYKTVFVAVTVYAFAWWISYAIFSPMLRNILTPY